MKFFYRLPIFLIAILITCSFALGQESDDASIKVGVAELYLAKDDGKGQAGEQATNFITTDVPIYCVVQLDSAAPVTVKMNLVAVAVPGVKGETRVVSTSYTTRDNQSRVDFSGRPVGPWVAGRYRVDIFIGGAPAVSREFAIQKATQAKPGGRQSVPKSSDKSRLAGAVKKL